MTKMLLLPTAIKLHILIVIFTFVEQQVNTKQLIQSNILFRHGDRTPTRIFPNSEYHQWYEGLGQLTNAGKNAAFHLGKLLAKRYVEDFELIPPQYNHSTVQFTSSNVERCLMSAQLVAAGFFPPTDKQIWNTDLLWQPVPIQTTPRAYDCMLQSSICRCPSREVLVLTAMNSKPVVDFQKENQIFFDLLTNYTGENVSIVTSGQIFGELWIEKELNMTLPFWTANTTMDRLLESYRLQMNVTIMNQDIVAKRIYGGNLLWTIIDNMSKMRHFLAQKPSTANINNESEKTHTNIFHHQSPTKINFFSAHDVTVVSFLNTIGIPLYNERVHYSAAVLLELYIDADGILIVELYLRNKGDDFKPLTIPLCNSSSARCTLENFLRVYQNVSVEFTKDVCFKKPHIVLPSSPKQICLTTKNMVGISIFVCAIVILVVMLGMCMRRHKGYSRLSRS